MLVHEWRELEMLCERLGELRARLAAAQKTGNTGYIEGLNAEMDRVAWSRDRLIRHISTSLGSAAADRRPPATVGSGSESHSALMPARD